MELVNLSPVETRDVIVQAGTFGEHQFTSVKYLRRVERPGVRRAAGASEQSAEINRKFFQLRLPPGTGIILEAGLRRFANKPTYTFPWHGDTIPVR